MKLQLADDDWTGTGFARRTMRTAAIVGVVVSLVLASYGQYWAIGPFVFGLCLSCVLFYSWDAFVRALISPAAIRKGAANVKGRRSSIVTFSLIKYLLVGLVLYVAVRIWHGDSHRAMVFLAGFILLQLVIGLRAINRAMMDRIS